MSRYAFALALWTATVAPVGMAPGVWAVRMPHNPIITAAMLPGEDGGNINGPSMIRVPDWVPNPLGRYYLYFAHHNGKYIRLAYADRSEGPWKIHPGGVLNIRDQKAVTGHVASPDVVVDRPAHRVYLFYHGKTGVPASERDDEESGQQSSVAVSEDGIHFTRRDVVVGPAYLRVFQHRNTWYAVTGRGALLKAASPGARFQPVGQLIGPEIPASLDPALRGEPGAKSDRPARGADRYSVRHSGTDMVGDRLTIYFTCVGHRPERILATFVDLEGAPETWRARGSVEVLRPEEIWEGAHLSLRYSQGGISHAPENGIRDPAVFRENGRAWLLYSTAGEHGIGIAELHYGETR
jgi:hypothetical protein